MSEAYIRVTNTPAGKLSVEPTEVRGDTESPAPALIVPVSVELFPRNGQTVVLDRLAATLWTTPVQGLRRRRAARIMSTAVTASKQRPLTLRCSLQRR